MTADELRKLYPHASERFIQLNVRAIQASGQSTVPVVEPDLRHGSLGKGKAKKRNTAKFFVRVESCRRRLLDEDNIAEKFHIDSLRYSGIIPGDSPDLARIVTTQIKVRTKEEECTVIEVTRME